MPVRDGLLALLDEGPKYGYQLKTEFEHATGGVWTLNVGQIYTTLDRLQRDGLVDATEADGQRSYQLTSDGRDALGAWWQATPVDEPPPRDELLLKVLLALGAGNDHAREVISRQRTALYELLQRHRRAQKPAAGQASRLVAEALLSRAEADLRWLDTCERSLNEGA